MENETSASDRHLKRFLFDPGIWVCQTWLFWFNQESSFVSQRIWYVDAYIALAAFYLVALIVFSIGAGKRTPSNPGLGRNLDLIACQTLCLATVLSHLAHGSGDIICGVLAIVFGMAGLGWTYLQWGAQFKNFTTRYSLFVLFVAWIFGSLSKIDRKSVV